MGLVGLVVRELPVVQMGAGCGFRFPQMAQSAFPWSEPQGFSGHF